MKLRFEHVEFLQGSFQLSLHGEFPLCLTVLLGPSGAGKTSLLEIIAGLRRPQKGRILLDNRVLCDAKRSFFLPARHRQIGYVPQDLSLFPHLTVSANLIYGMMPQIDEKKVSSICEVLEISPLVNRMPVTLSGGEQQRVAFARAILANPRLLLLDEPLSSLDASLKERIFPYILRMRDELKIPMLYVTHSSLEASLLGDWIVKLEQGRILAQGSSAEVSGKH